MIMLNAPYLSFVYDYNYTSTWHIMTDLKGRNMLMSGKQNYSAPNGAVYGLGLIGAAIYFISQAASFWPGVLGFLKALVWPVFLVYEALKALGA
jgi:hypothetical protein